MSHQNLTVLLAYKNMTTGEDFHTEYWPNPPDALSFGEYISKNSHEAEKPIECFCGLTLVILTLIAAVTSTSTLALQLGLWPNLENQIQHGTT